MDESEDKHTTASLPIQIHQGDTLSSFDVKEKQNDSGSDSVEIADEKVDAYFQPLDEDEKPEYRNGEPVITTGRDVSRFAVDIRDDGDESLTFRSIFLGTLFAGMGAALCQASSQIFIFYLSSANSFLPDLPFQACPDDRIHGVLAPDHLYRWEWMGQALPSTQLGHWHTV